MSKNNFTEDDLRAKGLVETSPGVWTRPFIPKGKPVSMPDKAERVVKEATKRGYYKSVSSVDDNVVFEGVTDETFFDNISGTEKYTVPETTMIDGVEVKAGDVLWIMPPYASQDSCMQCDGMINIRLTGLTPGLNGSKGLMREHWAKKMKIKAGYVARLHALKITPIHGPVKLIYIRHTSSFMDWDNTCASFKRLGDALVKAGIIKDDSPKIITEFIPKQIKCKRKDQHTEIVIVPIK